MYLLLVTQIFCFIKVLKMNVCVEHKTVSVNGLSSVVKALSSRIPILPCIIHRVAVFLLLGEVDDAPLP